MNAQETIDTIDNLIKHIANSDNERIERDLCDDPFEPVNIDILGNMYSYVRAEVVGQHDYYAGCDIEENCDIAIYLQRMDDFGTCDIAEEYKFIASIEWIKEWMQELDEYLHYDETHHYMDEFINSGYPLCSSYAKKAKELEE